MRRFSAVGLVVLTSTAAIASCDLYGSDSPFDDDDDAGRRPRAVRPSRGAVTDDSGPEVIVLPCPDDATVPDSTVPPEDASPPVLDAAADADFDAGAPDGAAGDADAPPPVNPVCVPTVDRPCVAGIALGDTHTCVRLTDGTARCWGKPNDGQLGIGAPPAGTTVIPLPTPVVDLVGATQLVAAQKHTCAILDDGTARCWGTGLFGRLGNAATVASNVPVNVVAVDATAGGNLLNVTAIAAGPEHTCASQQGLLHCWGRNNFGQLGIDNRATASSTRPLVAKMSGVKDLALGSGFGCATNSAGEVFCWGTNAKGQLGTQDDGVITRLDLPTAVANLSGATQVTTGLTHACALFGDRTVKCWGDNADLQLGVAPDATGATILKTATPTKVDGLPADILQIAAGGKFTCALKSDGTVWCWGSNVANQLGGTSPFEIAPTKVAGVSGAVEVRAGTSHTCARINDGSVRCWGQNNSGQVGPVPDPNGGVLATVPTPSTVPWQ